MRAGTAKVFAMIAALGIMGRGLPNDLPIVPPHPGTGSFLMLSDLHFDPYTDPNVMQQLGVKPLPACQTPASGEFSKFGSDTNYPLLKSTLEEAAAAAKQHHLHYDYVLVTGDFLAHGFNGRYGQCVGGDNAAYTKFTTEAIRFVESMIAHAVPGAPIFAALGNNDSDNGDYAEPSPQFLQNLAQEWSPGWGKLPAGTRAAALQTFRSAGYYALPHPTVANRELVILNTNLWTARHPQACSETDPDPGGELRWLAEVLGSVRAAGRTAALVMHIVPGIDGMRSSTGAPVPLWTDACTQKFIDEVTDFRGVVAEMYAGHIHRDDFRLFSGRDGSPLCAIHIIPAVSPIFLDNPALQVGWYAQSDGQMSDDATFALNLGAPHPAWSLEYIFTQAYGYPRISVAALEDLSRKIRAGNPQSGDGKNYAEFYGVGVSFFLSSGNWRNYSCAQTEITVSAFARCRPSSIPH